MMAGARKRPELLAPAGSLQKLRIALLYGADAVYCGGKQFGLRAAAENLTLEEFREGAALAHERGAKLYVTLNVIPRSAELAQIGAYAAQLQRAGVDAAIVSDPGVFDEVRRAAPGLEIHISTQANNTNYGTLRFWRRQGASRVVVARELSLAEIGEMRAHIPEDLEIEAFVHGAMCVSYSGRCLLSSYLTGRDSNSGACTQPCRWKYALCEEKRPGLYFPIEEDARGTYIMNSRDMCMIRRLPELLDAGVDSLKIEGRVKSELYVATVVGAYRRAIDRYLADPAGYRFDEGDYEELCKVSHRHYFEGFLDGIGLEGQITDGDGYDRSYTYTALVEQYDAQAGLAHCLQRNKFSRGDRLEVLSPGSPPRAFTAEEIFDGDGAPIDSTPHAGMRFSMRLPFPVEPYAMLRQPPQIKEE